jgi:hypothetical protein
MIGRRTPDDAQAFDQAWRDRASADPEIAALVRTAERLCEAAVAAPRAEFRADLRSRLMAEADTVLVPATPRARAAAPVPARRSHPVRRRLAGLTAALVAAVGTAGLVTSSASALPGEMLYPVKRGTESIELALHRGDASRGELQLQHAAERLAEAKALTATDSPQAAALVAPTLEDFTEQAESGSTALFSDFTATSAEGSVADVASFTTAAATDLSSLSRTLPAEAAQATDLCASCGDADVDPLAGAAGPSVSDTTSGDDPSGSPSETTEASEESAGRVAPAETAPRTEAAPTAAAPEPPQKPAVTPLPTRPTTKAPGLGTLTDPVIGALLGDEDQTGLVPGLLKVLLGPG